MLAAITVNWAWSINMHEHCLMFVGNSGWVMLQQQQQQRYTRSWQHVQYFCGSKQQYGCQRLGYLTLCVDSNHKCTCIAGCANTARVCTESWLWEKNPLPRWGVKPTCISVAPNFLVQCSANWATFQPLLFRTHKEIAQSSETYTFPKFCLL